MGIKTKSVNNKTIPVLVILTVLFFALFFSVTHRVSAASSNLINNSGAETGDTNGWTITSNLGNGWGVDPGAAHSGTKSFETSYGWDVMYQKIDLLANGFTQNQLDTNQPAITFSNWMATRGDQGGRYFLTYKLLGNDGSTVITSYNFGTQVSPLLLNSGVNWFQQSYSFNSYGNGVRYVYMEIGGRDQSTWAGHYGTHFDDASIIVNSNNIPDAPTNLGDANLINGSTSANRQPALSFTLSDSDNSDTVKYQIQIAVSADFSSPVVDYTSTLATQGAVAFTVGQSAGGGTYTIGSAGQTLADGIYYWRVKASDNNTAASAYSTANSGAVAFRVDTTAPILTLLGDSSQSITQGSSYVDPGASAVDAMGGNLTAQIVVAGSVNAAKVGTYTLLYSVTDAAGNSVSKTRTVVVAKTTITPTVSTSNIVDQSIAPTNDRVLNTPSKVVLNEFSEFYSSQGKTVDLRPNNKIYFNVTHNEEIEEHSITVKVVEGNTVTITISSKPFDVTMYMGETREIDVNEDGTNDISVKLLGVMNGAAQIIVKQLPKPYAAGITYKTEKPIRTLNPQAVLAVLVILTLSVATYAYKKHSLKKEK